MALYSRLCHRRQQISLPLFSLSPHSVADEAPQNTLQHDMSPLRTSNVSPRLGKSLALGNDSEAGGRRWTLVFRGKRSVAARHRGVLCAVEDNILGCPAFSCAVGNLDFAQKPAQPSSAIGTLLPHGAALSRSSAQNLSQEEIIHHRVWRAASFGQERSCEAGAIRPLHRTRRC